MSENQSGQHTESHAPRVLEYAKVPEGPADVAADLPDGVQRRNIASWVIITALIYLCAPVLYVDFVQTTLCDKLGASKAVANLPSSAAHVMVFVPLIMTWLLPHTRWVVPVLATSYGLAAVIGAVMAVLLLTVDPVQSPGVLIAATIAYGGLCGVALPTAGVFMWEVLARGVSESRRGVTFSLCFGFGPMLAVAGSMGAHYALQEKIPGLTYPRDYACLFAISAPCMLVCAWVSTRFRVSENQAVVGRQAFVTYMFGGLWDFLRRRAFVILTVSYVLMFSAWWVMNNATLHMRDVLGVEPKEMAGLADALRFGGKVVCGFALGWIYARFAGRTATMGTALLTILAITWALNVPGRLYLGTFALFGGGELAGVYYFSYIVSASSPRNVKRNTAFLGLSGMLLGGAPFALGAVADRYDIPASMWVALGVAVVALVLLFAVPARPQRLAASAEQDAETAG